MAALKLFLFFLQITATLALMKRVSNHVCYDKTYIANQTYESNLHSAFSTLPTTNKTSIGFFTASVGKDNDNVQAYAFCRNDIPPSLCQRCLNDSIFTAQKVCPNRKGAVVYFPECVLNYFNIPSYDPDLSTVVFADQSAPKSKHFKKILENILKELVKAATATPGGSLGMFASGNRTGPGAITIFGLVQCSPDLSRETCASCLQGLIKEAFTAYHEFMSEKMGGSFFQQYCIVEYDTSSFFNVSTLPPQDKSSKKMVIIVVVIVTSSVIITIASIFIFLRMKKKQQPPISRTIMLHVDNENDEELEYTFTLIKTSTNEFSDDAKLGAGGCGTVYKGTLDNGKEIAVKRLTNTATINENQMKTEVEVLSRAVHRNVVRLLGYSIEGSERLLIYEFVPKGSLENYITDEMKRRELNWEQRRKILTEVAVGLSYLHDGAPQSIVHCDLKPANILLDANMNAKIADFGTAKSFKLGVSRGDTSHAVGTFGYMAPEYSMYNLVTVKADVYSYGVSLLELIAGRMNLHNQNDVSTTLPILAWRSWKNSTMDAVIDCHLNTGEYSEDIVRTIRIGLLCIQGNPELRPTMKTVCQMLDNYHETVPDPGEPGYYTDGTFEETFDCSRFKRSSNSDPQTLESHGSSEVVYRVTDPFTIQG